MIMEQIKNIKKLLILRKKKAPLRAGYRYKENYELRIKNYGVTITNDDIGSIGQETEAVKALIRRLAQDSRDGRREQDCMTIGQFLNKIFSNI
jgi:hypothetical protein